MKYTSKNKWLLFGLLGIGIILSGCQPGDGEGLDVNGNPVSSQQTVNDAYSGVQAIFTSRCIACHSGAGAPQGLMLTEGDSYNALINVPSTEQADLMLVTPGNAEISYLVHKIRGDQTITGNQMPLNGPPFLNSTQISTIVDWINNGALPPGTIDPNAEYIANLASFAAYKDWSIIDYSMGDTNINLGTAHKGDDDNFSRRVYANALALDAGSTGDFPSGSILIKEVTTYQNGNQEFASMGGLLAMVKRGADYNLGNGGWEWFDLSTDLSSITAQGADLMSGMCNSCHQQAALQDGGRDMVFAHPSEHVATSSDFADYKNWSLIDVREDNNPLLDNMAHGATLVGSVRNVYKKQLYANPDIPSVGYPIGTLLLKEG